MAEIKGALLQWADTPEGSYGEGDLDKFGDPLFMINGTPLFSCSQEQFDERVRENQISFARLQLCAPNGRVF